MRASCSERANLFCSLICYCYWKKKINNCITQPRSTRDTSLCRDKYLFSAPGDARLYAVGFVLFFFLCAASIVVLKIALRNEISSTGDTRRWDCNAQIANNGRQNFSFGTEATRNHRVQRSLSRKASNLSGMQHRRVDNAFDPACDALEKDFPFSCA